MIFLIEISKTAVRFFKNFVGNIGTLIHSWQGLDAPLARSESMQLVSSTGPANTVSFLFTWVRALQFRHMQLIGMQDLERGPPPPKVSQGVSPVQ